MSEIEEALLPLDPVERIFGNSLTFDEEKGLHQFQSDREAGLSNPVAVFGTDPVTLQARLLDGIRRLEDLPDGRSAWLIERGKGTNENHIPEIELPPPGKLIRIQNSSLPNLSRIHLFIILGDHTSWSTVVNAKVVTVMVETIRAYLSGPLELWIYRYPGPDAASGFDYLEWYKEIGRESKSEDKIVTWYCGHGNRKKGLTFGGGPASTQDNRYIRFDEIYQASTQCVHAADQMFIFESCFSGNSVEQLKEFAKSKQSKNHLFGKNSITVVHSVGKDKVCRFNGFNGDSYFSSYLLRSARQYSGVKNYANFTDELKKVTKVEDYYYGLHGLIPGKQYPGCHRIELRDQHPVLEIEVLSDRLIAQTMYEGGVYLEPYEWSTDSQWLELDSDNNEGPECGYSWKEAAGPFWVGAFHRVRVYGKESGLTQNVVVGTELRATIEGPQWLDPEKDQHDFTVDYTPPFTEEEHYDRNFWTKFYPHEKNRYFDAEWHSKQCDKIIVTSKGDPRHRDRIAAGLIVKVVERKTGTLDAARLFPVICSSSPIGLIISDESNRAELPRFVPNQVSMLNNESVSIYAYLDSARLKGEYHLTVMLCELDGANTLFIDREGSIIRRDNENYWRTDSIWRTNTLIEKDEPLFRWVTTIPRRILIAYGDRWRATLFASRIGGGGYSSSHDFRYSSK